MSLRHNNLSRLADAELDVVIIGGGINGAVSAAGLAARGVQIGLIDRSDFAAMTSQQSSNLIWGGFKYLETYDLRLVWELCTSRNLMMRAYPDQIREIEFLATLDQTAPFPTALAALGTWGYWGMGRFATRTPRLYRPSALARTHPIINITTAKAGIRYNDAYLPDNDARFVWGFVRTALDHGAIAANYTELSHAERRDEFWHLTLTEMTSGESFSCKARAVVNAAGPWADPVGRNLGTDSDFTVVFSKGIHLVVPRLIESERILAFFDDTGRLFYVIPMADRSVIGTTDTRTDDPTETVSDADRTFLLEQINARLERPTPLTTADIIAERCGVRPLVVPRDADMPDEDWTSLSRKHEVELDADHRVVTILGGKLTDCLNVAEEVVQELARIGIVGSKRPERWFGEPDSTHRQRFFDRAAAVNLRHVPTTERDTSMVSVLWRRHGMAAMGLLDAIAANGVLGEPVLRRGDILRGELALMREREMIVRPDDFLRRRTKLALITPTQDLQSDPGMTEISEAFDFAWPEPPSPSGEIP